MWDLPWAPMVRPSYLAAALRALPQESGAERETRADCALARTLLAVDAVQSGAVHAGPWLVRFCADHFVPMHPLLASYAADALRGIGPSLASVQQAGQWESDRHAWDRVGGEIQRAWAKSKRGFAAGTDGASSLMAVSWDVVVDAAVAACRRLVRTKQNGGEREAASFDAFCRVERYRREDCQYPDTWQEVAAATEMGGDFWPGRYWVSSDGPWFPLR